ncbi:hypothetical protein R0135_13850 [Congregibacter variabilis]|uniref:Exo-alpha-sialidase n=1 Tax=Congregibacter variabilis TaxID=3081200 RepID=A0ABZ0I114_9GAMM|nr:hypothetical protein R0135_13850 [Congregibacter sp. IMCC43200]
MSVCHASAEDRHSRDFVVEELPSPAPLNSSLSRVSRDELGGLYLSWVAQGDSLAQLAYSKWLDGTWSGPQTISEGANWFVNWADFPVLSMNGGADVAHWLQSSGEGSYDYDVVASFYDQSQAKWGEGVVVNRSGIAAEHGFVSMLPMGEQQTLIAWLDGRNTKNTPDAGPMTLRGAVFDASGNNLREWELDRATCDCCQTSAAMTEAGPVVVYRDRSPEERRDIAIVRMINESWTAPALVHKDDWQVMGCPVNGPAVAARDNLVAVAWFTAKDDLPTVKLALSSDSGATFSPPSRVAGPDTNGRVDVEILVNGQVVVSWMDTQTAEAKIMLSRFKPTGQLIDGIEVAVSSASRRSGFPVIESVDNTVYVSWTDVSDTPRVRVARVDFDGKLE